MVLDEGWLAVAAEIRSCEASYNKVLYKGWVLVHSVLFSTVYGNVAQQTCHRAGRSVAGWLISRSVGRWLVDQPVGRLLNL